MQRVSGFAEQGANVVWTQSYASANVFQETYPFAKIAVYVTGTTTLATLFGDNNTPPTPLANPFTADENGWWWFYAPNGRYDIQIWPKTPPNPPGLNPPWTIWTIPPWTIGDVLVADYGVSIQTGGIELDNGVCSAHIGFDQNCNVLITGNGLGLSNGTCSMTISFAPGCEILIKGQNGNILASLDQNGDFTTAGCIYTPCLFVSGNASIGGNLAVAGQISATGSACLHVPCLYVAGDATVGGSVQAGSVEASVSIWSGGLLGSQTGIETRGNLQVDGSINAGGNISATGNASIGGNLNVNGTITAATPGLCLHVSCLNVDNQVNVGGSVSVTGGVDAFSLYSQGLITAGTGIQTPGNVLVSGYVDAVGGFKINGGPLVPAWQSFTPQVWYNSGAALLPLFGVPTFYYMLWANFAIVQIHFCSNLAIDGTVVANELWVSMPFFPWNDGGAGSQSLHAQAFPDVAYQAVVAVESVGPVVHIAIPRIGAGTQGNIWCHGVLRVL